MVCLLMKGRYPLIISRYELMGMIDFEYCKYLDSEFNVISYHILVNLYTWPFWIERQWNFELIIYWSIHREGVFNSTYSVMLFSFRKTCFGVRRKLYEFCNTSFYYKKYKKISSIIFHHFFTNTQVQRYRPIRSIWMCYVFYETVSHTNIMTNKNIYGTIKSSFSFAKFFRRISKKIQIIFLSYFCLIVLL